MEVDLLSVNKGFSKQVPVFDDEDISNPILQWMRSRTMQHVNTYLQPGHKILELNAGTGIDAVYFAQHGFRVHATDLSDGMVAAIQRKITQKNLQETLTVQQLSYTEINKTQNAPFDYVFSNFGGLNCVPDLRAVSAKLPSALNPGAYMTFVIMPPVCPWELGLVLKGNFKQAFRRLKKRGVMANLEGEQFMTYYFTPRNVLDAFGKDFKLIALEGLGTFCPPPHKKLFALKYPKLFKTLIHLDERFCKTTPFNSRADHFIITMRYQSH